jgi:hypothetical protein
MLPLNTVTRYRRDHATTTPQHGGFAAWSRRICITMLRDSRKRREGGCYVEGVTVNVG